MEGGEEKMSGGVRFKIITYLGRQVGMGGLTRSSKRIWLPRTHAN